MSVTPPPVYDAHYTQSSTTLTPYLQLSHILSLTWLAYPILSILFIAFRLQLSLASAQDAVDSAKDNLLRSCKAAEKAATSAASMPRFMAVATNDQIADAVNGTLRGARAALVFALTVMEAIINFIIDLYRSTFLCFLELVVRGALSILIGAVQEFNNFLSSTFNGLRTSIQNDISAANSVIKTAVDAINKVNPFGDISVPQINVPSLDSLANVTLPSDFQDALIKLNSSIPSVAELKDKVQDIVDTPFELLKKEINDTFAGLNFDAQTLPVPAQNSVVFCDQMNTSVVDDLGRDLIKVAKIGVIILIVLALLLIAVNCLLEWYKWRCLKNHMQWTREAWTSDPTIYGNMKVTGAPSVQLSDHNLMQLQGTMSHPLLSKIAHRISAIFRLSHSQHIHLQWFFHYVFHPPALACFLIGFIGLLSVELQLLAIGPLEHKYTEQAVASVNDFQSTIATSINASMYNQSAAYANDINGRVDRVQTTINEGLFGWVNVTTVTLNDTINTFYTDIQDAVNTVFNGTILESPVQEFIRCFIGSKVDAIESALTFLHDNLVVNIPRVNDTVLVLSPESVNEATRPIATAAIGGDDGNDQGIVGKLVNAYIASLKKERIMFCIFIGLWGFVVLMALCVIFWHSYGRDWVEAYKKRRWQKEQRAGNQGFIVPFRDFGNGDNEKGQDFVSPSSGGAAVASQPQIWAPQSRAVFDWDSLPNNVSPVSEHDPRSPSGISSPRKVKAFGAEGKDLAVSDSSPVGLGETETQTPWRKRFTLSNWKKDVPNDEVLAEVAPADELTPPGLRITTERGSEHSYHGINDSDRPMSTWSTTPPKPSLMASIFPPKLFSTSKKQQPRASTVPTSIEPSFDPYAATAPQSDSRFPVPIHHAFEQATSPTASQPVYTNYHMNPPQSQSAVTSNHARNPSQPMDPFASPFDDPVVSTSSVRNPPFNPFRKH